MHMRKIMSIFYPEHLENLITTSSILNSNSSIVKLFIKSKKCKTMIFKVTKQTQVQLIKRVKK